VFRALRHRNFNLFFQGQLLSLVGTWMQKVALVWLVYRLTDSPVQLGLMAFCNQFPTFALAPLGGVLADRWDRRRWLLVLQTLMLFQAAALTALTFSGDVQVWHLYFLSLVLAVASAFEIPARQAFLKDMVGREDLTNAIALNSSMFNGARIAGPAVAGLLVAWAGEGWCFALNTLSYLAVILCLVCMTPGENRGKPSEGPLMEGFRYAWRTAGVRRLLGLLSVASLLGTPYHSLLPIFAGDPEELGMMMSAGGVGALLGAMSLARRRRLGGLRSLVARACGTLGLSLMLFAAFPTAWLLIPVGASMVLMMASTNTVLQSTVPDEVRGRVLSLYLMVIMGLSPLGALAAGALAAQAGAPVAVALGGAACLAAAAWQGRRRRGRSSRCNAA